MSVIKTISDLITLLRRETVDSGVDSLTCREIRRRVHIGERRLRVLLGEAVERGLVRVRRKQYRTMDNRVIRITSYQLTPKDKEHTNVHCHSNVTGGTSDTGQ